VLNFSAKIIKYLSSNTSCFTVFGATGFSAYVAINRPSYESSQEMLATCRDPNYVYLYTCMNYKHS